MPATFAKGTKIEVGDGATPTEVFTLIPGVRTINGPDMSAEQIDVTSHDTPGGFRTKIQGLKDWGVLSFEMLWDPNDAQHLALFEDYISGDVRHYKLTYPTTPAKSVLFSGFVGSNPTVAPFDGALTKTAEIIVMGDPAPVWT